MLALAQRFRHNAQAASLPGYADVMLGAAEELEAAVRKHFATRADQNLPLQYLEGPNYLVRVSRARGVRTASKNAEKAVIRRKVPSQRETAR
jgi:hypothetical protein